MKVIAQKLHQLAGNIVDFLQKNRQIRKQIKALADVEQNSVSADDIATLPPPDEMLQYLEKEMSRRRIIEEKAKTNALAITLALSAMLAGVALVGNLTDSGDSPLNRLVWIVIPLQVTGIVFLLTGGLLALNALRTVPTQMWTVEDEKRNLEDEEKSSAIASFIVFNQHYTNIKSNHVDTSYSCIRNGVIVLAGSALAAVILALTPVSTKPC